MMMMMMMILILQSRYSASEPGPLYHTKPLLSHETIVAATLNSSSDGSPRLIAMGFRESPVLLLVSFTNGTVDGLSYN